jgi:Putative peptidoglycan binding domain
MHQAHLCLNCNGYYIIVVTTVLPSPDSMVPSRKPQSRNFSGITISNQMVLPGSETISTLSASCSPEPGSGETLQRGDRGESVARLQRCLTMLGHYSNGVDGVYGDLTESAVTRFQGSANINPNGIANWPTRQELSRQCGMSV